MMRCTPLDRLAAAAEDGVRERRTSRRRLAAAIMLNIFRKIHWQPFDGSGLHARTADLCRLFLIKRKMFSRFVSITDIPTFRAEQQCATLINKRANLFGDEGEPELEIIWQVSHKRNELRFSGAAGANLTATEADASQTLPSFPLCQCEQRQPRRMESAPKKARTAENIISRAEVKKNVSFHLRYFHLPLSRTPELRTARYNSAPLGSTARGIIPVHSLH